MNPHRLTRKQARLGLRELAGPLGVPTYWLHLYEQGKAPWPEGLQRRYEQLIAAKARNKTKKAICR